MVIAPKSAKWSDHFPQVLLLWSVGHCHERVVKAASDQLALLNTNTRYLQ